uniref:Gustatory receptor n=1 Tax=Anopheles albimanus TaxID=7167 RepID=A0A182FZY9_ANOAL
MVTNKHYDHRFGSIYPLFQLLGYSLVPLRGQVSISLYTLTATIVILYTVLDVIVAVYSLLCPETIFFLSDAAGLFADAIQFEIPLVVALVPVVLSLLKIPLQKRIAQLMDAIDGQLDATGSTPRTLQHFNHRLSSALFATLLIYNVIPATNEMIIISRISANVIWYRNCVLKVWFFILIRLADSFFLLHIEYIRNRYQMLNYELREITPSMRTLAPEMIHQRIVRLKRVHNYLKELNGAVNERFGWQLFGVITMLFICTTIDGYWMYANLHYDSGKYKVESFLCAISPLLMFYMLFSRCQRCINEGQMTFFYLHNAFGCILPTKTMRLIQNFSKQLNNEPVHFSAANFFDLKLGALSTIFASITTYLVIYINFIPKTDTFEDYNKEHNLVST